jgi:type III restriction enzyme
MAKNILKKYQEEAVNDLVYKSKMLFGKKIDKRTLVFQAPTGSGKTFMMSAYIRQMIDELRNDDICFLWLSPGKGELQKQSYNSLRTEFPQFPEVRLLEEEFFGLRRTIDKNEVVVCNWEKLSQKDSKTGKWKNTLMKDKETVNFRELVQETQENGIKIILVIDESHSRHNAKRAFELREDIICPFLTIEMSATPILKEGDYNEKTRVEANDVIEQGMIKKEVIINEKIDKIADNETTSQELVMEAAYRKQKELTKMYKKIGVDINPLVLIQIPVGIAGEDKKDFVESFLAEKNITKDNGRLAVWLNEEKRNQEEGLLNKGNNKVEFLIFKQAIDTGWDCPRAQILVRFREIKSLVFEIQTVGRILRMPEAKHYEEDELNKAFVYTNVKSLEVKKEDYNPNIIKSVFVKRDEKLYKPIILRSYYRHRVDFGDIKAEFYNTLEKVFCEYFEFSPKKFEFGQIDKNKKKIEKKIDIKSLSGKDELILNKEIDAKYFDDIDPDELKADDFFNSILSDDDKERAFYNIIKLNLNGFAPKRSLKIVKNALYSWFKKYLGINLYDNGIIFIQNVVLNNSQVFDKLFDEAIQTYIPVKNKEKKERVKLAEKWNENWEIADNRNYNPNTYKAFSYKLSLYKSPQNKKVYLESEMSEGEKAFMELIDKKKDKILWWWKNGDEHMALNFGIKFAEGSTFQPDFLVMYKDGRLGIYDTKGAGFQEDDNKLKAEALQKYIKEENKRRKKDFLTGGIIIKERNHFFINSDDIYNSYNKNQLSIMEEKNGKKKNRGWRFFEI